MSGWLTTLRCITLGLSVCFISFLQVSLGAQGCSDAGVCSLPSFKPKGKGYAGENMNQLTLGLSGGAADHSIAVVGANLDYSRMMGTRWNVEARITYVSQSGNDISVSGPGDIYLNLDYHFSTIVTVTGGVKLPLSDGNTMENGLPLPMDYQSSLGTLDLVLGAGFRFEKWQLMIGWQQPLTDNDNTFDASLYPAESPIASIQSTNEYKRKGDILLRLAYPVTASEKITFTPSLLPIYHLGRDVYTDESGFTPVRREIEGSDGLTLNAAFQFDIQVGASQGLQVLAGFPFLVRETRPDGLTRGAVLQAGYSFHF